MDEMSIIHIRNQIKIIGSPDVSSSLYVSNHVTYLDIIVINQLLPVNFIAKMKYLNGHNWKSCI